MIQNRSSNRLSDLKKYAKNSLSFLTLSDSLQTFHPSCGGYIAYKTFFKSATILGDPIVSQQCMQQALDEFTQEMKSKKYHMNFFLCTDESIRSLRKKGFTCLYVGMEGVVELNNFSIAGRKNWKIRSSVNYAKKHDMIVKEYTYKNHRSQDIEKQICSIANEWEELKKTPELSFAFGSVDFTTPDAARYFYCEYQGEIVAFISYYPIYGSNSYYLDLTRRAIESPRGAIDYCIVKSFEMLKNEDVKKVYIGFSPFSFLSKGSLFNSRFYSNLFTIGKPFFEFGYPAKSEFFFKKKFSTTWEPNYVVFYPRISIRNLLSLIHSMYEGGIASFLIKKIKYMV
jgi:phosphatidylglycerol lysyltransferase